MVNQKGRYAWTVKVGEKGQIVIPKQARGIFSISPGEPLILLGDQKRGIAIMKSELVAKLSQNLFSNRDDK